MCGRIEVWSAGGVLQACSHGGMEARRRRVDVDLLRRWGMWIMYEIVRLCVAGDAANVGLPR